MPLDIARLGSQIGTSILTSLKSDSAKVRAMALAEGDKLVLTPRRARVWVTAP